MAALRHASPPLRRHKRQKKRLTMPQDGDKLRCTGFLQKFDQIPSVLRIFYNDEVKSWTQEVAPAQEEDEV